MNRLEHSFSWSAILRILLAGVAVYLVWTLKDIFLIILLSLMLASALNPLARFLTKRFSVPVSSILIMLLLLLPLLGLVTVIIPSFFAEFPKLLIALNSIISSTKLIPNLNFNDYIQNASTYVFHSTSIITGFIATYITIIFLTIYIIIDYDRMENILVELIPKNKRAKAKKFIDDLTIINGQYIRGNLLISVICTVIIMIGLLILHVPYAIPLALFAGITDLLPLVGAIMGAIPSIIISFAISPPTGLLVMLLFVVYQQFENNILIPNVYNRVLSLSPLLSFIAVLIGSSLFGGVGAFIALPIAASIPTIIKYLSEEI